MDDAAVDGKVPIEERSGGDKAAIALRLGLTDRDIALLWESPFQCRVNRSDNGNIVHTRGEYADNIRSIRHCG